MKSKLGCHWIRTHPDGRDLSHVEKMQYPSVKLFEWHWSDRDACRDLLAVLPQDAYILARDHPMSEQKADMISDPVGTGKRHADEWADKVRSGRCHLPTNRSFFLGINEPDATTGDRTAIDKYTESLLDRLREHGLRGGAFNFSTGHPRSVDGTPNTPPDYSVFERSHQAIVRGHHIGVLHIYGTAAVPCAPGHYDRLKACTWQDVQWVVGEMGADEHVVGGGKHDGYLISMNGHINDYAPWLDTLILGINDSRIHSYQVFTYDFSHPWDSFNVREIRDALESYQWRHMHVQPTPPEPQPPEPTPPGNIRVGEVTAPAGVNVRSGPGTEYAKLGALAYGSTVLYDREDNGWLHSVAGWVSAQYVGEPTSQPPTSTPQPQPTPTPAPAPSSDCWQRSIEFVLEQEGGLSTDPNDPGNYVNGKFVGTKYGISANAHPDVDIVNLTVEQAKQIYKESYWIPSGAANLDWPMCLAVMDLAVNGGVGRAQQALNEAGPDFSEYMAWRNDWYTKLDSFDRYGRAWIRRTSDLMREASKP